MTYIRSRMVSNGDTHDHVGGDGAQIAHGSLSDLLGHLTTGAIIGWSGYVTDCPAGFAVCDGTAGTPDLTAEFII
jgi:hypothetical protein